MTDDQFLDILRDRFDDAHSASPGAASPPPDLWNRILAGQTEGKTRTMNATMSSDVLKVPNAPRSWRSDPDARAPRISRFGSTAAAALLVLALLGGVFIASQRGPGGGDFSDLHYAAQPLTPEASPISSDAACNVEPLTLDEVMAIVENPYANLDADRINIAGFPSFLAEPGELFIPVHTEEELGEPMDPEDERVAREITASYLACRQQGTLGQVFALLSPDKVQQVVFGQFPGFRAEEDVRAMLETALDAPAQEVMYHPLFEMNVTLVPATGEDTALAWSPYPDYPVVYIGTQGMDASGNVLARSDARDIIEVVQEVDGPVPSLGAVSVMQYPGDDRWYVNDAEIVRDTGETRQLASPEAEVCAAEPLTAETVLAILDDPNAYAAEVAGMPLSPESVALMEEIRAHPESLVLASVTNGNDQALLVVPQEGVLPAAESYLDCWQRGTAGQAFALMAPHMISEYDSLVGLPRDEGELQVLLDAPARELPASDRIMPTFVLDEGRTITVAGMDGFHGYSQMASGVEVAFVGTNSYDRDGNALIGGNIDDRTLNWAGETTEVNGRMSFGALTLIRYPGTEQWLVYDHWIELEPSPMPTF